MQIDLEPHEYRATGLRSAPSVQKSLMRGAAIAGVWFAAVVLFGRYADHGQPWFIIASAASAPGALLAYVAISLD